MESRIERLCIERGLKMTGQRRVVARVLSDAGDHPDVEELYRRASALDQHISIATVYRTVRLFEEQGILERRDFGGGRARYEPSEDGPHYHLIDVETGKVIEFQDPEHERLMHAIAARLGFEVVSLRLELFGRRHGSPQPADAHQRGFEAGRSGVGVLHDGDAAVGESGDGNHGNGNPGVGNPGDGNPGVGTGASAGAKSAGSDEGGVGAMGSGVVAGGDDAGGGDPRLRGTIKGASR